MSGVLTTCNLSGLVGRQVLPTTVSRLVAELLQLTLYVTTGRLKGVYQIPNVCNLSVVQMKISHIPNVPSNIGKDNPALAH